MSNISDIIGKVPVLVEQTDEQIVMHFSDGSKATWQHQQDCCEWVVVEDVTGDWEDLYDHPLLVAEERTSDQEDGKRDDLDLWTFYTFRSIGGSVDVRWHGSSNGYYSVDVDFHLSEPRKIE